MINIVCILLLLESKIQYNKSHASRNRLKMGYFSQRKKHERDNLILNITLGIVAVLTVCSFDGGAFGRFCNLLQFHFYIITLAALIYALLGRFFIHSLVALLLLIVNFGVLTSAANIVTNTSHSGSDKLTILYQNNVRRVEPLVKDALENNASIVGLNHKKDPAYLPESFGDYQLVHQSRDEEKSFILTTKNPLRAGRIHLSPQRTASFLVFENAGKNFVFINLNFANLSFKEEKNVFDNLAKFILGQDEPVIIIGDFGVPAWSKTFKNFLAKTDLEIKNRIIMTDGNSWFNPFIVPSINVLGYRNLGLKNIDILSDHKGSHPLRFDLNF